MSYLKLMKLLYLAEREFLLKYGESLTGDQLMSLKHGPVLSQTLDLFTCGYFSEPWNSWIEPRANYELGFRKMEQVDPACPEVIFDDLSKAETDVLDHVFEKYGSLTRWEIRDLTHTQKECPEWHDPHGSSAPIYLKTLLTLHGKSEAEADNILEHLREVEALKTAMEALV